MHLIKSRLIIMLIAWLLLMGFISLTKTSTAQDEDYNPIFDIEWNADGSLLAVGFRSGILEIRDGVTGDLLYVDGSRQQLFNLAWSPDNERLAIAQNADTLGVHIAIFNTTTRSVEAMLTPHNAGILGMTWNSDGTRFAVASTDIPRNLSAMAGIDIWEVTAQEFQELDYFASSTYSIDWRPNSDQLVVTVIGDRNTIIRDSVTGAIVGGLDDGGAGSAAYSPDGTMVASLGENTLNVFDANTYDPLKQFTVTPLSADFAWSPDSTQIVVVGSAWETENINVYNVETDEQIPVMNTSSLYAVDWDPNDGQIAYGGEDRSYLLDTACIVPQGDGSIPKMRMPCGTVSDSIWPTYSWWAADDADWYHIYVDDVPTRLIRPFGTYGLWVEASEVCNGDICEFRPVDGLANTSPNHFGLANSTYQWTIRSLDSSTGLASDWQPLQVFEVVNPVPTLIAPTELTNDNTGFPTYTWTPVPDADWYQVWVGSQSGTQLINIWLEAADVCDEQACRYQSRDADDYLRANQYNALYTWSVRAYNSRANVYGLWQTSNIFILALPLGTTSFTGSTPILNMPGRQSLTLTWQRGSFEEFYQVWVGNAAHQALLLPSQQAWVYHQAVCVDNVCSLTVYFDGVGVEAYLGRMNASYVPVWSSVYPLTVIEPSGEMAEVLPPTGSPSTEDGLDAEPTPSGGFVPPSDSLPPVEIPIYPDICTDNPLCDSPFGDE